MNGGANDEVHPHRLHREADVDLENLTAAITEFVAGIRSHHPERRYTSFQHPGDPNRFIHIGEVVEEVLPDWQKQPFFQRFTQYLPGQCSAGPEVTRLDRVASAAAQVAAQTATR
jgi:hypothetical protein